MSEFLDKTGWSISKELFNFIINEYPPQNYPNLLELGTGESSLYFKNVGYNYTGIEHDKNYINKYDGVKYVLAEIDNNNWYNKNIIIEQLNKLWDIIIIDGPPKKIGRSGMLNFHDKFKSKVIIFDDINRKDDLNIMLEFCNKNSYEYIIMGTGKKQFGIIKRDKYDTNNNNCI